MSDQKQHVRQIYEAYADILYRFCFCFLSNEADAMDAVQNTMIKLMERKEPFSDETYEKNWLMKVAANECRQILRHWWRRNVDLETLSPEAEETVDSGQKESEGMSPEEQKGIRECLSRIPARYRIVLYLFYYESRSTAEIGIILQRNESTVRAQLTRGRKMLKESYVRWLKRNGGM